MICEKFLKRVFKVEWNKLKTEKQNEINAIQKLKSQIELNKHLYDKAQKIYPNGIILHNGIDKLGGLCIVVCDHTSLFLLNDVIMRRESPSLYFDIELGNNRFVQPRIVIVDFCVSEKNIGHGTIIMKGLIKFAYQIEASSIIGELSAVDEYPENKELRNSFYRKFGFEFRNRNIILDRNHFFDYEKNE